MHANDTSLLKRYGIDRLREVSGCNPGGAKELTFRNGTGGNRTRCHAYSQAGCSVNFTYCLSDAGHQWYGAEIDNDGVCRYVAVIVTTRRTLSA